MKNIYKVIYQKITSATEKSLKNNKFLMVLSIILAFAIWSYITETVAPDVYVQLKGIPVDFDASISGTQAEKDGYRIYESSIETVDIEVSVSRKKQNSIKKNMFTATLSSDRYADDQPVAAEVRVSKTEDNDLDCAYKITSKSKASVTYYKEVTKNIEINNVNAPDITAAEGYTRDSITPGSVTLTGPEPILSEINSCLLKIDRKVSYDSSTTFEITPELENITFYDADNNVLNTKLEKYFKNGSITFSKNITVTVNILKYNHEIKIAYAINKIPEYFDEEFIRSRLVLDPQYIAVSLDSNDSVLNEMTTLDVLSSDNINLSRIGLDFETEFDITKALANKSSKLKNKSQPKCKVHLDTEGLSSVTIPSLSTENLKIINPNPSKYAATVQTPSLNNITLIGPSEMLEKISPEDIIMEADISKSNAADMSTPTAGSVNYDVNFILPKEFNNVWVYDAEGTNNVVISVTVNTPSVTSGALNYNNN